MSQAGPSRLKEIARSLLLCAAYVVVAKLGLMMDAVSGFATLVWAPTGLSLVAVLLFGYRVWPAIALGAFIVNAWLGAPLPAAAGIAAGNTLEAVAGAYALRRASFRISLDRLRDALGLILLAAMGSTLLSPTIGVVSLVLGGVVAAGRAAETWRAWWIGDLMGDLVIAPLLLAFVGHRPIQHSKPLVAERSGAYRKGAAARPFAEAGALATLLVATSLFLFGARASGAGPPTREAYLVFPLLIWAAVRFGPRGASVAVFGVTAIAIAGTALGGGPFVRGRLAESLVELQTFMAIAAATTLILGSVSEERRQALRLRDTLITLAAHELRTPLTALQLEVQMLARRARDENRTRERLAGDAAAAEQHVKRFTRLVEQLLDASRIMAGRMRLDVGEVDVGALIRSVVARLPEAERARVTVVALTEEPILVRQDRARVEQILYNLVTNALKYGEKKPVEVSFACRESRMTIAVRDRGAGIPREALPRIFGRFERGAPAAAELEGADPGGFGLGLWVVRQMTEAMGGGITVESELMRGSTFTVDLPVDLPPDASVDPKVALR